MTRDLDALHYRHNSTLQYAMAYEALRHVRLTGNETILDVGCGDGRMAAELAMCVPKGQVMAVDSSAAMIASAQSSFPNTQHANLTFAKIAAEDVTVDQPVDIVLLMNTLHWIRNPTKALRSVAQALKPAGKLVILTYPKESPYWRFLNQTLQESAWAPYRDLAASKTILTSQEYQNLVTAAGLLIEDCAVEEKVATYASAIDLMAYVKGWLHCYVPLPKEHEEPFLQKAAENAKHYSLTDNGIQLPFLKMTLTARKP